jgi:hypothetical protein
LQVLGRRLTARPSKTRRPANPDRGGGPTVGYQRQVNVLQPVMEVVVVGDGSNDRVSHGSVQGFVSYVAGAGLAGGVANQRAAREDAADARSQAVILEAGDVADVELE